MKKRLLAVLALPIILAACASNNSDVTRVASEGDLVNNNWVLTQVDSKALNLPEPFKAPNLELTDDLSANGHSGCNRYFGQAELKDGKLRIEKMGMTMMACPEPAMTMEQTMTKSLTDWSNVSVSGNQMILTNATHTLTFERNSIK